LVVVALAGSRPLPQARLQAASPGAAPARGGVAQAGQAGPATAPSRAFLDQYCETCHNNRLKTGGLTLDGVDPADVTAHAEVLEKVVRKLRSGQMPPQGRPRADETTTTGFVTAIETRLDRAAAQSPNPGRVASHRLNRAEYVNAIEDLLALRVNGNELLPGDMAGFGFDNNADVLAITPGLMARYMAAATKISRVALASPDNRPMMQLYKVEFGTRQDARMNEDMPFGTHGGLSLRHSFPLDGEYLFAVRLKKNGTVSTIDGIEEDEHEIELRVDHALVKRFTIGGRYKGPDPGVLIAVPEDDVEGNLIHDYRLNADKELEIRVPVKAGLRLVTVAFTDSAPTPEAALQARGGYLPGVDTVAVSGPFNGKVPLETASRRQIFTCRPSSARDEDACARQILSTLARRAYRRPVAAADIDPLVAIYKQGRVDRDFDAGIERALEALLSSPKFLIRIERDPAGAKPGALVPIADLELASRLSFFLWRSIPDDELLDLAERGKLKDPAVLTRQVGRMLADRRSVRFMNGFVEQWLEVRNIQEKEPDATVLQGFDSTLRDAMAKETELFFESQVRDDRPIQDLLRANYTFLNERLARHYGITDVYGSHFRRVALTDENRFGLLGQASVLTVTSYANRTSVVLRGKWVLENLLGAPPPPPPPNVPPLKENDGKSKPAALRERMEAHRASPVCASCHSRMDPLGFALEHFDAVGRWRENDGGADINSTITWAGRTVDSPKAFREALLGIGGGNEYTHTVVEKLLTYALGRGIRYFDAPTVRRLGRDAERDGHKWSSLIAGVVTSLPFQMRRVESPAVAVAAVR
jgi:hypothetical protein